MATYYSEKQIEKAREMDLLTYGAKTIHGRKQSAAMADREAFRNAEELRNNDRMVKDASLLQ